MTDEESDITLLGYKWRIRDGAIAGAESHGVSMNATLSGLAAAGAGEDQFPDWDPRQSIHSMREVSRLPAGSIVSQMDGPGSLTLFRVNADGGLEQIGGPLPTVQALGRHGVRPVLVNGAPPTGDWVKGGEAARTGDIEDFRSAVYAAGKEAQSSQSWCSTYDTVMRGLGITASSQVGYPWFMGLPRLSEAVEVAALPEGTFVLWQSPVEPHTRWRLFVRDDSADNPPRTRLVTQAREYTQDKQWTIRSQRQLPPAGQTWGMQVGSLTCDFTQWPVGTAFSASGTTWAIARDQRAAVDSGVIQDRGDYGDGTAWGTGVNVVFTVTRWGQG